MPDVTITIDRKKITTSSNSLLIEVCKKSGIEIPSFCYYPGLSLQGACRMCLVGDLQRIHKADSPNVKTDLEIILRVAQKMGYTFSEFMGGNEPGDRADFGQSRGAQSGEADQQAVWLAGRNSSRGSALLSRKLYCAKYREFFQGTVFRTYPYRPRGIRLHAMTQVLSEPPTTIFFHLQHSADIQAY